MNNSEQREFNRDKIHEAKLYCDHFQNYRRYNIPKAQLLIADIPYNVGNNAYGSNPSWYIDGDNKNGESNLAGKSFFNTDKDFRIPEFLHFCSTMIANPNKKETGKAPAMIVFCEFEQQFELIKQAPEHGLKKYINIIFRKNFSAQVLKANMRIVGNCEYGLVLYHDKLPKFNNDGKMIFNCFDYPRDMVTEKIHPTQKPTELLEQLIRIFTDEGDVVIDPVAGSGSSLISAMNCKRRGFGFEIVKDFHKKACDAISRRHKELLEIKEHGFVMSNLSNNNLSLFENY